MAEASKGSSSRTYKVLRHTTANTIDSDGNEGTAEHYSFVADIEASDAEQAIRLAASEQGTSLHSTTRFVAVPERNWTEIGVRVEIPAPVVILETITAAVEPPADGATIDDLFIPVHPGEPVPPDPEPEQGSLTDAQFEQRKAEIAARRNG